MSRLKGTYQTELMTALSKEFNYVSPMEVPKLERIVLNMGLGEAIQNIKVLDAAVEELALIAGQHPIVTRARKSIASFKLRAGMPIGCMVTLRRTRMYDFFDKLVNIALPRVRDFRGLSDKSFDGRGNYTLGIDKLKLPPTKRTKSGFSTDAAVLEGLKGAHPVVELLLEYLEDGRIKVDPAKNEERVTLHDPCNLVRWGGVSEQQREILARVVSDFQEMTPNREDNFCCGGGGGMLSMSEYGERRVASGGTKADQIRTTGAKIVATPCHNCADQLLELSKHYKLGTEILAVVELVYNALD